MNGDTGAAADESWTGAGLPPAAAARTAEAHRTGTWSSALSTGEFAAVRSAGFEPVGQVMGSAVYQVSAAGATMSYGYYDCGYLPGLWGSRGRPAEVSVSGRGSGSAALVAVLVQARQRALERMRAECLALGGDGVVAAELTMSPFPTAPHCLEFKVIGTAIRAQGSVRPARPFTTHLDGQGFAKLLAAGWVPVELLVATSIGVRHDDWTTAAQNWFAAGNQEVTGWTDLVTATRHDARSALSEQARRSGADGVVLGRSTLKVRREECTRTSRAGNDNSNDHDHVAEATMVGSSVAAFNRRGASRPATLTVMPLDSARSRR